MLSDDPITSSESEDDISVTTIKSKIRTDRRKHHRMWTIDEVVKLLDGISHFGLGKWTDIKNLFFHSSSHRTPVDIRVSFFIIHLIKINLFFFIVVISECLSYLFLIMQDKWRNLLKASCSNKHNGDEEVCLFLLYFLWLMF